MTILANMNAAQKAEFSAAVSGTGVGPAQATRILRSAARGITPIVSVMATPPTYAEGTVGANSTINTGLGPTAPNFPATNLSYVTSIGGANFVSGTSVRSAVVTPGNAPTTSRNLGHGGGFGFETFASVVGPVFDSRANGSFMMYVTDLTSGLRQRIAANDIAATGGLSEKKLTFAGRALRRFEVYFDPVNSAAAYWTGVNVPAATDKVWAPTLSADSASMLWLGDSWGLGIGGTGATNLSKLAYADYIGERLGIANPICPSSSGTGYLATASGTATTFRARIGFGDIDASRIGNFDLLLMPSSLNDFLVGTAAALQAEIPLALAAARAAQPNAIIVVCGPQITTLTTAQVTQAYFDATQAGVAAFNDPNTIYIDNSPAGQSWLDAAIDTVLFSANEAHGNNACMQYWGGRVGNAIVAAIKAKYGLAG